MYSEILRGVPARKKHPVFELSGRIEQHGSTPSTDLLTGLMPILAIQPLVSSIIYPLSDITCSYSPTFNLKCQDCATGEDVQHHDLVDPPQRVRLLRILSGTGHQLRQVNLGRKSFHN